MRRPFSPAAVADQTLQRNFDGAAQAIESLAARPLDDATITSSLAIGTGDTPVYHGLGATARGWVVTDRNANAVVWRTPSTDEARFMNLRASAPVTVSLIVF